METVNEAINRIIANLKKDEMEEPKYTCNRCKDRGFIAVKENGSTFAMLCPDCTARADQKRWMKRSGITENDYRRYTFDTFTTDTEESQRMKEIALRFLANKDARGMGVFGRPGTGKTHLCIATCQALGKEHYYWQYRNEIQKIKSAMYKDLNSYLDMIDIPKTKPYLYIDDLFKGALVGNDIAQQDKQIMFDIINERYVRNLPTIISSEYSLNQITKSDEAIGSRIFEMLNPYIIKVTGVNRRLKYGK